METTINNKTVDLPCVNIDNEYIFLIESCYKPITGSYVRLYRLSDKSEKVIRTKSIFINEVSQSIELKPYEFVKSKRQSIKVLKFGIMKGCDFAEKYGIETLGKIILLNDNGQFK